MWNNYCDPAYKHLVVELFCVLATVLKRNPELEFSGEVDVEALIDEAVELFETVNIFKSERGHLYCGQSSEWKCSRIEKSIKMSMYAYKRGGGFSTGSRVQS